MKSRTKQKRKTGIISTIGDMFGGNNTSAGKNKNSLCDKGKTTYNNARRRGLNHGDACRHTWKRERQSRN